MGNVKKILSVMLSCAIAFSSAAAAIPASTAALRTEDPSVVYDNTIVTESKEEEVPFNVFDIYDAFYGIPKTTTTTSAATTSSTTTTKATTKATTTSTAATTQRPVVTTTAATTMPPKYTSGTGQAVTTTRPMLAAGNPRPGTSSTTAATTKTTAKPTSATTTKTTQATTKPVATTTTKPPVTTTRPASVTTDGAAETTVTTKPQVLPVPNTSASSQSTTASSVQTETTASEVTTIATRPGSLGDFYLNGIDVSEHQAYIDWEKVEQSGIDFAIIRAGYGKEAYQRDRYFDINMQNIQKTNIHYGIYWFSYAMSVEEALQEAKTCCEIIKDYDGYTFPIYFDIELNSQRDYLTTAQVSAITETFCSYLEEQGYYTGIYSCASFLTTKIYSNVLEKYDVWVAQYNSKVDLYYGDYGIWQYSSVGHVDGINTVVDMNYCYLNYPLLVSPETYTGIVTTYPQSAAATTTTTAATGGSTTSSANGSTTTAAPVSTSAPKTTAAPVTTASATTTAPVTTTTAKPVQQLDPYSYSSVGVSVSGDNGYVNWNCIKDAGYSFGVVRAGGGPDITGSDPLFYVNMENAITAGVDRGVYWEIMSTTEEDMLREAEAFHKVIKDYSYEYPIYLDLTNPAIRDAGLSKEELTKLISTFCSYFEDMRYYIGIRADEDFLCNSLDPELFKAYDVYLVNSGDTPVFSGKYGVWQFGTEKIDGVFGDTEVAYCYRVYPSVMSFYGLNQRS